MRLDTLALLTLHFSLLGRDTMAYDKLSAATPAAAFPWT